MEDNGISAWAAYQYGKMSAETAAHNDRCIRSFKARLRGETVLSASALADENIQLRQLLAEKDRYIRRLDSHIQGVEGDRAQLHAWGDAMEAHVATLELTIADLRQRLSASSIDLEVLHEKYDIDTAGLKLENEELRRSLALAGDGPEAAG